MHYATEGKLSQLCLSVMRLEAYTANCMSNRQINQIMRISLSQGYM